MYEQVCANNINHTVSCLSLPLRIGVIDLRDLKLKKSALDKLGLPFDVVEGEIVQKLTSSYLTGIP